MMKHQYIKAMMIVVVGLLMLSCGVSVAPKTASPSTANYQLRVEGSAYATGSFINGSSRELKQDISELP